MKPACPQTSTLDARLGAALGLSAASAIRRRWLRNVVRGSAQRDSGILCPGAGSATARGRLAIPAHAVGAVGHRANPVVGAPVSGLDASTLRLARRRGS